MFCRGVVAAAERGLLISAGAVVYALNKESDLVRKRFCLKCELIPVFNVDKFGLGKAIGKRDAFFDTESHKFRFRTIATSAFFCI